MTVPLHRAARHVLGFVGLVLLAALAWHWRASIADVLRTVDAAILVAAVALGLALAVVQGLCFAELMRKNGASATRTALVAAFLLSQPAKYVPGKVATPILQRISLGPAAGTATTLAANVDLALVMTVQVTGLGVAFAFVSAARPVLALLSVAATAVAVTGLLRVDGLARLLVRRLRRPRWLEAAPPGPRPSMGHAMTLAAVSLALVVAASVCVLRSTPAADGAIAPTLASFFLGFASSLVAFVVPAGVGIREAATAGAGTLIPGAPPPHVLVALALLFRCWQLTVDAASAVIGWALSRASSAC